MVVEVLVQEQVQARWATQEYPADSSHLIYSGLDLILTPLTQSTETGSGIV